MNPVEFAVIVNLMLQLVVEPPDFPWGHAYFLVSAAEDRPRPALQDHMVSLVVFRGLRSVRELLGGERNQVAMGRDALTRGDPSYHGPAQMLSFHSGHQSEDEFMGRRQLIPRRIIHDLYHRADFVHIILPCAVGVVAEDYVAVAGMGAERPRQRVSDRKLVPEFWLSKDLLQQRGVVDPGSKSQEISHLVSLSLSVLKESGIIVGTALRDSSYPEGNQVAVGSTPVQLSLTESPLISGTAPPVRVSF